MNLRLAMAGVLASGLFLALPVAAQNFPDVPENHWAYEAIEKLKADGLIVGYPDGTFGGKRPATRYEFAAATYRAYEKLKAMLAPLGDQLDELTKRLQQIQIPPVGPGPAEVGRDDIQQLKAQIDALKEQIGATHDWRTDVEALRKLMDKFGADLDKLGTDRRAMADDLRSLDARITALEKRKERVRIGGDVNIIGFASHSIDGHIGVDWTGNTIGTNGSGQPVGLARDTHVLQETAIDLSGTAGDKVNFVAELLSSSLLAYDEWFSRLAVPSGPVSAQDGGHKDESSSQFLVHHFEANWDTTMLGSPLNVRLGRLGYASSNYLAFARIDPDPYVDIPRWDDHKWYFDGGNLTFNLGNADLAVIGGKQTAAGTSGIGPVWPMDVGRFETFFGRGTRPGNAYDHIIDVVTHVGGELTMHLPRKSHVAAQYMILDGNALVGAQPSPRLQARVLGADAEVDLGNKLAFYGAGAKCDIYQNEHVVQSKDTEAYDLSLAYKQNARTTVGVGYRYVAPFFGAPGSWDRLGYWYNPTDIKGWVAWANHSFPKQTSLWVSAQFLRGTDRLVSSGGLGDNDKIMSLNAYVRFPLGSHWKTLLGWEGLFWDLAEHPRAEFAGGKVNENYYTIELSHDIGKASTFRLGYQICDYNNKTGASFFNTPGNAFGLAKAGLFFTQMSIGF